MNAYRMTLAASAALTLCSLAVEPEITNVKMTQGARRVVTVEYTIENAPAVVTLDIQTNGVSIGAANISGGGHLTGEVNKVVEEDGTYRIRWDVASAWPDHDIPSGVRAVVSAWSMDTLPDVLVADMNSASNVNYYTSVDALPGGLLGNPIYRTSKLVMKRIHAAGIPWMMGSAQEVDRSNTEKKYEVSHMVTLTNDYYMGVFELTQAQFYYLTKREPSVFTLDGSMRPLDNIRYVQLRQNHVGNSGVVEASAYPNDPNPDSLVGTMRSFTGLKFEIPSDAQWEFACRAMNGDGKWNDGSSYTNGTSDANLPGRYLYNQANPGLVDYNNLEQGDIGTENGTAEAGSFPCNGFGLYDMHGNVGEWVLDFPVEDRTTLPDNDAHGAVNANGLVDLFGQKQTTRILRGGAWCLGSSSCRSAARSTLAGQTSHGSYRGVRLVINVE